MSKVILISGGSDGLGRNLAQKLSPHHEVIILSHNPEKLKSIAEEYHCDFAPADVTNFNALTDAIATTVSKHGRIDVLINCAGIWTEGKLEDADPEKILEVMDVNALGTIFLTKAVLPQMQKQGEGRIINIISLDGQTAKKDHSVYSASKWAVTGFTKCLQEDLHGSKISVTGVYPGVIKTSLFEKQGVNRDLSHALPPDEISTLIEFVINLSPETTLPEISIKNINNPNTMDDTAPQINLDLNPDLITTQTGITPVAAPPADPASNPLPPAPVANNVIDITPGAVNSTPEDKPLDITPVQEGSSPVAPAPLSDTATPGDTGGLHLADVVPHEAAPAVTEPQTAPVAVTPVTPAPEPTLPTPTVQPDTAVSPVSLPTPPVTAQPDLVTPAPEPSVSAPEPQTTPAVSETPAAPVQTQTNPLSENPDLVKL